MTIELEIGMEKTKEIDTDYKLIPLSEITDEAREIAVRWGDNMVNDFISEKHKLASDIMNYARRYSEAREKAAFEAGFKKDIKKEKCLV